MTTHNADLLVIHAAELVTCRGNGDGIGGAQLQQLHVIEDGALAIRDGRIVAAGPTGQIVSAHSAPRTLDASGRLVTPGLVDSHSHLVFGGTRHRGYEAKVTRWTPAEQLEDGIRYTVRSTQETSDEQLIGRATADLDLMLAHGTTTLEAKTGYGLTCERELRLLRLTAGLQHPLEVVPTFLALHVLPE
ncbi:MAG: amidohydrolase family protein, partial [Gammaproteobacteria bacterium]|nr:amidohydrolase family protein [Gammaproteobacteria bacterium]